ncbi:MAG: CvpA family protein [Bacteroidota bacterium]
MNLLDIIIAVPLLWGIYRGFTKGLIIEIVSVIAFVLAVWIGIHFSWMVAGWLEGAVDKEYTQIAAFAVTFLAVLILVFWIGKRLEKVVNVLKLSPLNKVGGAVIGAAKIAFMFSVLFYLIGRMDPYQAVVKDDYKKGSLLYEPVASIAPKILPMLQVQYENTRVKADSAKIEKEDEE